MRFNIISNLTNGVGLQRDFEFLSVELEARGHQVQGVQYNAKRAPMADVNIFDELVVADMFKAAPVQWVLPHPEWWSPLWNVHHYDKVLAKTRDCERIFRALVGDRCQYLGWAAKDLYNPTVTRQRKFLHVAGKSSFKNTHTVIQGCRLANIPLTVIGEHTPQRRRVPEVELIRLMNSHFCHVMPSAYEGYGHVLHESQSTGQVLITTDAPPMNDITPSFCLPSIGTVPHQAGVLHKISVESVAQAVRHVQGLSGAEIDDLRHRARASYEDDVQQFHRRLDELVGRV